MIANLRDEEQHKHKNGGGWVANTASVSDSVFVGPWACVYGKAILSERVRVEDTAQVSGTAVLSGDVRINRNAWIDKGTHSHGTFSTNEKVRTKQERLQPTPEGL